MYSNRPIPTQTPSNTGESSVYSGDVIGNLRRLGCLVLVALVASACGATSQSGELPSAASLTCDEAATAVVERLDAFLAPYRSSSVDEFFDRDDLPDLEAFQNDVANIVVQASGEPSAGCSEQDLEAEVENALSSASTDDALTATLIDAVLNPVEAEVRQVRLGPSDDLTTVLPLLASGSTISLEPGEYELEGSLLVQSELTLSGSGSDVTTLVSSAEAAVIAVLPGGDLTIFDLSVRHAGDLPASVMVSFNAPLTMADVHLSGGVADADGSGGSGLVVTADTASDEPAPSVPPPISIQRTTFTDNEAAGVAVTGMFAPTIAESTFVSTGQCGICLFDDSGGRIFANTFRSNAIGLQIGTSGDVRIDENSFSDQTTADILIDGVAAPVIVDNAFAGDGTVGIDAQDEARPEIVANSFASHAVAVSTRAASTALVSENTITGADVGILTAGTSAPEVTSNNIEDSQTAAVQVSESATGTFRGNAISSSGGAGFVIDGNAEPTVSQNTIVGGVVGVVLRGQARGAILANSLTGQDVGIEAGEQAEPQIEGNTVTGALSAGVILSGSGSVAVTDNVIAEPVEIGLQFGGDGAPAATGNVVSGGDTAVLITESSSVSFTENRLANTRFGIGVSGEARPVLSSNEIEAVTDGGISFEDGAAGEVRANRLLEVGVVGIRVAGSAAPDLVDNQIFASVPDQTGSGRDSDGTEPADAAIVIEPDEFAAGVLYTDSAGGTASGNDLFGFTIGLQVGGDAAPSLTANTVDGSGIGGVGFLWGDRGAGSAQQNRSTGTQLGFQFGDQATPQIVDNEVEAAAVAAFLFQGQATAGLSDNTCPAGIAGVVVLDTASPELGVNEGCQVLRQ